MINRHFLFGVAVLLMIHSSLFAAGNLVDGDDADLIQSGDGECAAGCQNRSSALSLTDQNSLRPENFVENEPGNPGPFLNFSNWTNRSAWRRSWMVEPNRSWVNLSAWMNQRVVPR